MEFIKKYKKEIIVAVILLIIAIISEFILADIFSDPNTYTWCYSTLDQKKTEVMTLTAVITGTSVVISAIPGNAGSAVASQLSSLSIYLLIILIFIYLEKYTLTVIGVLVFRIIVPIIALFYMIALFYKKNYIFKSIANKLLAFGIVVALIVPSSVYVSNMIQNTYDSSTEKAELEDIITEETLPEEDIQEQAIDQSNENSGLWESLRIFPKEALNSIVQKEQEVIDNIKNGTTDVIEKVKGQLATWIEQIAIMIVTSCVIPVIAFLILWYLTKVIFNIQSKNSSLVGIKNRTMNYVNKVTHNNGQNQTNRIETKDNNLNQ